MQTAACHCGAVSIEFASAPESVTACNCSICHRLGVLWAYYTQSQVNVICTPDAIAGYIWGDKCIEFFHCTTCGCVTHYVDIDKNEEYGIAINARLMRPEEIATLPVREFDGASM
jgi:hypothetical protein